jgi:hypothetical protein
MFYLLVSTPFGIDPGQYQALVVVPNYLLVLGALVLWVAFIILGIIARRYEFALGERTDWQLIYCGVGANMMLPKGGMNYVAYLLFLVSGILSVLANYKFYKVTKGK